MSFFNISQKVKLARSLVTKSSPAYVQYYITARCNLNCEQCNIIYAAADCKEMNIHQIRAVAENFAEIGVCMVLLIGGEPFVRKDLPEIIEAFTKNEIHVRMQTNGLADEDMLLRCVEAGGHDISISLDTLDEALQDQINGGVRHSWRRAIRTVSIVNRIFPDNGTGFFGMVLMPQNMEHIVDVVEFATEIGWGVSLVPVHVTSADRPLGFRIFDDSFLFRFPASKYLRLREVLNDLKLLRRKGMRTARLPAAGFSMAGAPLTAIVERPGRNCRTRPAEWPVRYRTAQATPSRRCWTSRPTGFQCSATSRRSCGTPFHPGRECPKTSCPSWPPRSFP